MPTPHEPKPSPITVTAQDFVRAFGKPASPFICAKIDEYRLTYAPLTSAETVQWMGVIQGIIAEARLPKSGVHRLAQWEAGWGENLSMLRETHDAVALIPRYFGKHEILRWNRELIRPEGTNFEYYTSDIIISWLFELYFSRTNAIYDFGCGTGYNLLRARSVNSHARLFGLDWTTRSQDILVELVRLGFARGLTGRRFDFFAPDKSFRLEPHAAVYTVGALEQIGEQVRPFVDYLLSNKPDICLHVEPIRELLDENHPLDRLCAQNFDARSYLRGFLPYLRTLEQERKVTIYRAHRTPLGAFLNESYSVVVWSPRTE